MTALTLSRTDRAPLAPLDGGEFLRREWTVFAAAPGMRVEDAWVLPIRGARDQFHRLIRLATRAHAPGWTLSDLGVRPPAAGAPPLVPLVEADEEWAAEQRIADRTRIVVHLGWARADRRHRAELAVLAPGDAPVALAALARSRAFRRLVIAPAVGADLARRWAAVDKDLHP